MQAQSRQSILLASLILGAMLLRVLACLATPTSLDADPDAYGALAITLAKTGTFGLTDSQGIAHPTAFRPLLYPWLLSFTASVDHLNRMTVICLHAWLGGLTVWLTVLASRRLIGGTGFIAGLLVAVDPILVQQSTLLMTETLAAALGAAVIWWWTTRDGSRHGSSQVVRFALVLGVLLSLAFLCRPTFLVWAGLLIPVCLFFDEPLSKRVTRAALVMACILLTVGVWTARNQRHFGRPIWATSHGGYTILLANNPMFYDYLRTRSPGDVWDPESFFSAWAHRYEGDIASADFWAKDWSDTPPQLNQATETRDDDLANQAANATIRREPMMFAWSCVVRLARLWSPMPHMTSGRAASVVIAVGVYYFFLYLTCIAGLVRHGRQAFLPKWWAFWLLVVTLSGLHAIYWSNLRMRSPATSGLAVLAAASLVPRRRVFLSNLETSSAVLPSGDQEAQTRDNAKD